MDTSLAEALLSLARAYAALGLAVALAFALWIAPRLDPGARGSSPIFRAMILPGATLLWPVVISLSVRRWRDRARGAPR